MARGATGPFSGVLGERTRRAGEVRSSDPGLPEVQAASRPPLGLGHGPVGESERRGCDFTAGGFQVPPNTPTGRWSSLVPACLCVGLGRGTEGALALASQKERERGSRERLTRRRRTTGRTTGPLQCDLDGGDMSRPKSTQLIKHTLPLSLYPEAPIKTF